MLHFENQKELSNADLEKVLGGVTNQNPISLSDNDKLLLETNINYLKDSLSDSSSITKDTKNSLKNALTAISENDLYYLIKCMNSVSDEIRFGSSVSSDITDKLDAIDNILKNYDVQ